MGSHLGHDRQPGAEHAEPQSGDVDPIDKDAAGEEGMMINEDRVLKCGVLNDYTPVSPRVYSNGLGSEGDFAGLVKKRE